MTISAQDLDLIKKEVAGVREFYNARIDSELPPLKEEVSRVSAQIARIREMWKNGEKQALLGKYGGQDRSRVPYGKYQGAGLAGPGLHAESAQRPDTPTPGPEPTNAGRVAVEPEGGHGFHHSRLRRRTGPHPGSLDPLDGREPGDHGGSAVLQGGHALGPLRDTASAGRRELVSRHGEPGCHPQRP